MTKREKLLAYAAQALADADVEQSDICALLNVSDSELSGIIAAKYSYLNEVEND